MSRALRKLPVVKRTTVRRTTRKDHILLVEKQYTGDLHASPATFNSLFAEILQELASELTQITNQWADPEVVVWTHVPGKITAELPLSAPVKTEPDADDIKSRRAIAKAFFCPKAAAAARAASKGKKVKRAGTRKT